MHKRLAVSLFLSLFMVSCSDGGSPNTTLYTGDADPAEDLVADLAAEPDRFADVVAEDTGLPPCEPDVIVCINGKLATCDSQFGWLLEACPEGLKCENGECVEAFCTPLDARCEEHGVQICSPDGTGWSKAMPCPEGTICQEGACVQPTCTPGDAICSGNKVLTCDDDGMGWTSVPCDDEEVCFDGICIECIGDDDCGEGLTCQEGLCVEPPLEILTNSLPDGKVGEPYETNLDGAGGVTPYFWTVLDGDLPVGLALNEEGVLSGTPETDGNYTVNIELSDDLGDAVTRSYTFTIFAQATDLIVTTGSPLKNGTEGEPYQAMLEASGGEPPYFWGIADGALPAGLSLGSDGLINGTPADHGTFTFTVKVFDNAEPTGTGGKEFEVTIKIAPLEIIGNQEYDLLIIKVILLPLITTVDVIPIPYSTQLEAKGGVKPYHWSEQPLPSVVDWLIPNGGIPAGLTLEEDGQLHGSTTDTESVVSVSIPFTGIDLTGYFFMAEVEDSQENPDSASALYLIPTVPVSF